MAFVIGPMCAINRTSAEPPAHVECAEYSARVCPFLANPKMVRRERGLEERALPAGFMIPRNPGVALVWKPTAWRAYSSPQVDLSDGKRSGAGILFDISAPSEVSWWCEGRAATRAEVMASIDGGYPLLVAEAERQKGGLEHLAMCRERAMTLVPA